MKWSVVTRIYRAFLFGFLLSCLCLLSNGCGYEKSYRTPEETLPNDTIQQTTKAFNLVPSESQTLFERNATVWGSINVEVANIRQEPNTGSTVVAQLRKGEKIELDSLKSNWWSVVVRDSLHGFIRADLVDTTSQFSVDSPVVSPNKKHVLVEDLFLLAAMMTNQDLCKKFIVDVVGFHEWELVVTVSGEEWDKLSYLDKETLGVWFEYLCDEAFLTRYPERQSVSLLAYVTIIDNSGNTLARVVSGEFVPWPY